MTPALDRHSWYFAGFAQDDWAVNRDLTLNIGIRWEMDTPLMDANRRMNGFDTSAINPISGTPGIVRFAGIGGYPQHPYRFDWNNFGPRVGFAWKLPGAKGAVIRGGYGIFFAHPFDNTETVAASLGFSVSATLNSADGATAPFLLRNGVPPVTPSSPALNDAFGAVPSGRNPTTAVSYFARDRVSGYSHQFNFMQRQVRESTVVEVGFLGNLGRKLPSADLSTNQIPPQILGPLHHSQADRPFPQFSDVILLAPSFGISNYCAGLFKLEKRLSHGFSLVGTYVWSKFLGNTNDTANSGAGALGQNSGPYSDYYNRRADYGPAESDIEHRVIVSSVFELPFGSRHPWLTRGLAARLAGGWSIGQLTSIQAGPPLTATTSTLQANNGYSAGLQRANVARNPNLPPDQRSLNHWFDTDAFSLPAPYAFGNEGVGIIRGPRWINSDLSIRRDFAVAEHARCS